jgi:hypothetical protein
MQIFNILKKYFPDFTTASFILLFAYAGLSKILDYQKFRVQLGLSPLLTAFAGWVAWIIPSLELFIAFLLIFPKIRPKTLYACFSLMVLFTAYIVAILRFSAFIPCSCGGILQNMTWATHLKFNAFFILIATGAILLSPAPDIKSRTF